MIVEIDPDAVRDRWLHEEPLPPDAVISRWLEDASAHLAVELPDLVGRLDEGEPGLADLVEAVLARMVIRVFQNPSGFRQQQSGDGPFTGGGTSADPLPGRLYLPDADRSLLTGQSTGGRGARPYTIDPYAGRWTA